MVAISKMVLEAGYECCHSVAAAKDLLSKFPREIEESDVAETLGCMARTYTNMSGVGTGPSSEEPSWNITHFMGALNEKAPHLDWTQVMKYLDYEHFFLYDAKGLEILLEAWKCSPKGNEPFPAHVFFGRWANLKGQLSALYQLANSSSTLLSLPCYSKPVIAMDNFASSSHAIQTQAALLVQEQLNSLDLFECVMGMADSVVADDVKVFLELMAKRHPELVFLSLFQIQPITTALHRKFVIQLLDFFSSGNGASLLVMTKLWQLNPEFYTQTILEMYTKDATSLTRILDFTNELKILPTMLDVSASLFNIDLAALASRYEYLNLGKWLKEKIQAQQDAFIYACLTFLHQKHSAEVAHYNTNAPLTTVPLAPETATLFLRILSECSMSPDNTEVFNGIHKLYAPKLSATNTAPNKDENGNTSNVSFKPDVEEEANSNYERIYNGQMTIDQMITHFKTLSTSNDARDQDVFACMIHNLFDEYHFFPKYPEKELAITSVLFGQLIQHQLVSYVPLGIALRCILDALRNPPGSKMFNFGVGALTQFRSRLSEWPQYCTRLMQIPNLQQADPELLQSIRTALQAQQPVSEEASPGLPSLPHLSVTASPVPTPIDVPVQPTVVFASVHVPPKIKSSDDVQYITPSEAIQDKVLFIINNVARNNLKTKTADLLESLTDSMYEWFSSYFVVKRISIEPNYHDLYLLLLDGVGSRLLFEHVLRETIVNIQILLNSEKTASSSSERSLLKNLGAWLGALTLARNKPIKHKHIAFKDLLLEGFDYNRLIVVIPFVCKVLEQCSKSRVFKPPNPWLMAIMRLLVELYESADLKLNLKFEIEVLCKSLSLELKDIDATSILQDRPARDKIKATFMATDEKLVNGPVHGLPAMNALGSAKPLLSVSALETGLNLPVEESPIALPNLAPYIKFNPQIIFYTQQPVSKRWVLQAITQTIREIIDPVVERSVAIASVSTRELVNKDFVMEGDENKMRKAAHLMAQNLAGSLAMVTCKEPLRLSLTGNLRTIFMANGLSEAVAGQASLITVADNLDLVCAVIEKAAMDRAVMEVDETLMAAFLMRKKHREQRPGQAFYDMEMLSMSRYPTALPSPLRAAPNGLQLAQLRVYEDFARIPRTTAVVGSADAEAPGQNRYPNYGHGYGGNGTPVTIPAAAATGMNGVPNQVSAHQILERFAQYISELEGLVSQTNVASFASLPARHDIRLIIRQILVLAVSSFDKTEAARTFAQKVVQLLYKSETQLGREMYVVLLEQLCEISANVAALVISWLTHADDERKYNVPVTVTLIKAGLVDLSEQDQVLATLIDAGRASAIDFAARLILSCLSEEPPIATEKEYAMSLEAFHRLPGNPPESVIMLLEEVKRRRTKMTPSHSLQEEEEAGLRERVQFLFAEWVRLYQHPSTTEKAHVAFITQLAQQHIFKVEDAASLFYRVCVEASIEHALNFKPIPGQSPGLAYQPIDAFSKLIVGLLKVPMEGSLYADKVVFFDKVVSVIVLVLAHHHEQRQQPFDQRPFLRMFSSLLSDLHANEQQLQPIGVSLLLTLSNMFHTLRPSNLPGFAFAWIQLISHRLFVPKLLLAENEKGWPAFQRLLIDLFQFLAPFLQGTVLQDTTRMLYRGTLRILLVLLHDFPEFLCDYYSSLCDVIPHTCIQLRNLILSAFPRHMRLPDPFTPNLKVDLLPEINQAPRILSNYLEPLAVDTFKQDLDDYLDSQQPAAFLEQLKERFCSKDELDGSVTYNATMLNALILHVGLRGIEQGIPVNQGAPKEIFQRLLSDLNAQGRYFFISGIANQLRFPNSHTHYFSCVLLYLFAECSEERIKEQITRVLLERLIVNRPHPWGLLITFVELIKNPRYNFWSHSFTRCAKDIERLFESVSR
ncbi:CCR4-Not complex component, Not1-domain-containing protein [Radiomyces spectabilis]|uniref:CCR4-Not complex component, Not1-domain-containing protein n=1 Tax=Radiomyces spectabilis TaxID=64574 RepID=UPI002220310A|nr:CCR4-Not complex component, Not1-domain-containing protein [Radiomyces spectabilis]KAI8394298.1 CCR4-Not complex component, Not1-domain-containing protein [Radiomyces spectabilis]